MNFPSEFVRYIDDTQDIYNDIINNKKIVVNIKSNKKKEEKIMLENEKIAQLEQLNSMRGENETRLVELKAIDINAIVEERIAEIREEISADVVKEHDKKVLKLEYLLEAIDEKIAEVEKQPVEKQPVEEPIVEEPAVEENSEIL